MALAVLHKPSRLSKNDRREKLRRRAKKLLRKLNLPQSELTIVICDDPFIRNLNATWRGKDRPTDVLSFPQASPEELTSFEQGEPSAIPVLGDIVISLETVEREQGKDCFPELERLLIHGVAHLLGYDHMDEHEALEMDEFEHRLAEILGSAAVAYLTCT